MLKSLRRLATSARREIHLLQRIRRDPRTPWLPAALLALALAYALSPIDLIPDFIPIIGHLDDVLIVPILVALALLLVPPDVLKEHWQGRELGHGG